ncbi:hypothetical protein J437_LFUL017063 [Ladona fulva]|uniref:NHR domain-containing protein n=1 Tax=Ladona fulva TaxID=123851 RepID=A0A8K0P9W4_LADFU|nr:hypothetical protein J437_LFUL017063 [Ladona fulva]
MFRYGVILAILSSVLRGTCQLNYSQHEVPPCVLEDDLPTSLSVQSQKDENGEWRLSFSTCKGHGNSSKITRLDLKQTVKEAGDKELVQITGVFRDASDSLAYHKLKFSPRGGRLAVISDDGMMAFRDNAEKEKDFAPVFTNRPLKNNELFEVKVNRKISAFPGWPVGIGVTTHSPETMEMPGWMGQLKYDLR